MAKRVIAPFRIHFQTVQVISDLKILADQCNQLIFVEISMISMNKYFQYLPRFLFSKNLKSIEVLVLAVLLFGRFCSNLQSVEFQPDETFWIGSSVRFDKFLAGDFESPIWNQPFVNYEVRPVPSYIVAISQRLGGVRTDDLPLYWDWALTQDQNISRGAMPSHTAIWWSRLPMAVISVLTLLGTIILIGKAHSRIAAYVFTLISLNDYFLLHLRRAMSEAPLLLFTVLALYGSYKLLMVIEQNSMKKVVSWSVIVGIFCGLAGQSKLVGLACVAIPILGTFILMFRSTRTSQKSVVRTLLMVAGLVLCTSLLIFIASYPFFYRNTLYRTLGTFYFRSAVVEGQEKLYASQVILPSNRINILFQRIFEYPVSLDSNGITDSLFHWINFLVVAFGAAYVIRQAWRKGQDWEKSVILLLGALTCAVPMLFVPFDWDRYYLYPIFFSCIFFVIGISQLFSIEYAEFQKQMHKKLATRN